MIIPASGSSRKSRAVTAGRARASGTRSAAPVRERGTFDLRLAETGLAKNRLTVRGKHVVDELLSGGSAHRALQDGDGIDVHRLRGLGKFQAVDCLSGGDDVRPVNQSRVYLVGGHL